MPLTPMETAAYAVALRRAAAPPAWIHAAAPANGGAFWLLLCQAGHAVASVRFIGGRRPWLWHCLGHDNAQCPAAPKDCFAPSQAAALAAAAAHCAAFGETPGKA